MKKPNLSSEFTMDDLRKLREYNSLRRIGMTTDELIADIEKGASVMQESIEEIRRQNKSNATA